MSNPHAPAFRRGATTHNSEKPASAGHPNTRQHPAQSDVASAGNCATCCSARTSATFNRAKWARFSRAKWARFSVPMFLAPAFRRGGDHTQFGEAGFSRASKYSPNIQPKVILLRLATTRHAILPERVRLSTGQSGRASAEQSGRASACHCSLPPPSGGGGGGDHTQLGEAGFSRASKYPPNIQPKVILLRLATTRHAFLPERVRLSTGQSGRASAEQSGHASAEQSGRASACHCSLPPPSGGGGAATTHNSEKPASTGLPKGRQTSSPK